MYLATNPKSTINNTTNDKFSQENEKVVEANSTISPVAGQQVKTFIKTVKIKRVKIAVSDLIILKIFKLIFY